MYRTPPNSEGPFADTPLPDSPATKNTKALSPQRPASASDVSITPRGSRNSPGIENLSDDEILRQIQALQKLLDHRRRNKPAKRSLYKHLSPGSGDRSPSGSQSEMDTSFGSTASLVRAVCGNGNRKRKGSTSPASCASPRRIKVTAQINAPPRALSPSVTVFAPEGKQSARPKPSFPPQGNLDSIENAPSQPAAYSNPSTRRFPELPPHNRAAPTVSQATLSATNNSRKAPTTPAAVDRIPPIVLRNKTLWSKVSSEIKRKGIAFTKAQNIPDGIRIYPSAESDYRSITKFFSNQQIPYHTYQLPSEKLLNVVLRGVPVEIAEKEIYDDLLERGFTPESVIRMRRTRDKAPMPLVLVKVSKEQKNIYHLQEVLSLEITVETLKSRPTLGQCYRCQRYGHAQSRCTAPRKCVSCGGEHPSGECPRPKNEPPTCANCGDTHPANYRGCVRCPRSKPAPSRVVQTPKQAPSAAPSRVQPGKSFSQAVTASTWTATQIQLKRSQTPKTGKVIPPTTGTKKATPKPNKHPAATRDTNIASMLVALQKLAEQITQVTLTCQSLLQSELSKNPI